MEKKELNKHVIEFLGEKLRGKETAQAEHLLENTRTHPWLAVTQGIHEPDPRDLSAQFRENSFDKFHRYQFLFKDLCIWAFTKEELRDQFVVEHQAIALE